MLFLTAFLAADQPDVVIDKRFVNARDYYDWMIDSVDSWGWGIEVDSVVSGSYSYPTTKVAIIPFGSGIDSSLCDYYRNELHDFVADGGRLLVTVENGMLWGTWQKDCNNQILGYGWKLGMNARRDQIGDTLTWVIFDTTHYVTAFRFGPPLDSLLSIGIDSLLQDRGPTFETVFPAETLLISNPSAYMSPPYGLCFRFPGVLGPRSYFGNGEVIAFENNMFGYQFSVPAESVWIEMTLGYNKPFLHNLLTTPVQSHEERVFRGVPFLLHTQVEGIDPADLFDDMDFFPAWIGTLYAWERYAVDFGGLFTEILPDSFTFRYILTPGGDFSVGPVSGDLDSALLILAFGERRTPFNWHRFLSESDRLHAPWIAPEPMQSLLGMALAMEIEHLSQNGFGGDLTYLRADDCSDSLGLSLSDSTALGIENRPCTFENRTGKPIWLLSSAIKHYRGSARVLDSSCWWELSMLYKRPNWEYRRRGNLLWSTLATDGIADTNGHGSRGFELYWSGDSASLVSYTGHFVFTGSGTLFVSDTPIAPAMPCTTRWFEMDYWRSDYSMNYFINTHYFDSELRMAISADSVWTSDVWELPVGIGDNPEPLLQRLSPGETVFRGGGGIEVFPEEITVPLGDSTDFIIRSVGPETLHIGWIEAAQTRISPKYAIIAPGDSMAFWAAYDGIVLVHDTLRIYSDDPETPVVNALVTTFDGIAEVIMPTVLSINITPNPFNSAVSISSPEGAIVEIFDINGRIVFKTPVGEGLRALPSGGDAENGSTRRCSPTEIVWCPDESLGSGVYLLRAKIGDESVTKRVVYLK